MADDPVGAATRPAGLPRQRFAIVLFALTGCVTSPDVPDPAVIEIVSGNDQVQGRGRPLHEPVVVRALDELGAPIAGAPLRFSVGPGGGVVDPQDAVTDSVGVAAVSWVLGDVAGMHRLVASVPKRCGASVEIAATTRPGDFDIQVVVDSGYTKEQAAAIRTAAERWTAVIVGDVPDHRFEQGFAAIGRCAGQPDIPAGGVVDDVQVRMNFDDDPGARSEWDWSRWCTAGDRAVGPACYRRRRSDTDDTGSPANIATSAEARRPSADVATTAMLPPSTGTPHTRKAPSSLVAVSTVLVSACN